MKRNHIERMRDRERRQDNALDTLEERMPEVSAQVQEFPHDMQYNLAKNLLDVMDTPEEQLNLLTLNINALDTSLNIGEKYASYIEKLENKAERAEESADISMQENYLARVDDIKSELKDAGFELENLEMIDALKSFLPFAMSEEGQESFDGDVSPDLVERSYMLLDRFGVIESYRGEGVSEGDLYELAEGYAKYATMQAEWVQGVKSDMGLSSRTDISHALDMFVEPADINLTKLGLDEEEYVVNMGSMQSNGVTMSGDSGVESSDNEVQTLQLQANAPRGLDL
jgi:hypothetical protein